MPLLTREEYKNKLDTTLELLKEVIPDFQITPQQYQQMTSQERYDFFVEIQNAPSIIDDKNERLNEINKYCLPEGMPSNIHRNRTDMVRSGGTKEDEEYNRKLFSNINRDDKLGNQKRLNYMFESINAMFNIGADIFLDEPNLIDIGKLAKEKEHLANVAMEIEHCVAASQLEIKPEFKNKWKQACRFGSCVGAVLARFRINARNELFMTVPFEFMTQEQIYKIIQNVSQKPHEKHFGYDAASLFEYTTYITEFIDAKKLTEIFNRETGKKLFSLNEFKFTKPENERYAGGVKNRIAAMREGLQKIKTLPGYEDDEEIQNICSNYQKYADELEEIYLLDDKEKHDIFAAKIRDYSLSIRQKCDNLTTADAGNEEKDLGETLKTIRDLIAPYGTPGVIAEQAAFEKEDKSILSKISDSVKDVNEYLDSFKYSDSFEEKQVFSEEDLQDARIRIAQSIAAIELVLTNNQELRPDISQSARQNLDILMEQSRAFNHASPGMTLEQIMQHSVRTVDLSGNKLGSLKGSNNRRMFMTITGPDGSMQQGFFTEAGSQDPKLPRTDNRNVAMSDVAHFLDIDQIIAKSTPLTLVNNGIPIRGTFMEKAVGCDIGRITSEDDPLFNLRPESLDGSLALKQIADMQILDFICGNVDRHPANMFYQIDDQGKITGIVGIDNDSSFLPEINDTTKKLFVDLSDINCISESLAKKIESLTPNTLSNLLQVNSLGPEEINKAKERLNELKDAVQTGKLPVRSDTDFANAKLDDFLIPGKDNHFSRIKDVVINYFANITPEGRKGEVELTKSQKKDKLPDVQLNLFNSVDKDLFTQDINPIERKIQGLEKATRFVFFGSDKYKNVQTAVKELHQNLLMIKLDPRLATQKTLDLIEGSYKKVETACEEYLQRKTQQGKINATGKTGRRISEVKSLKAFCQNKAKALKYVNELQQEKLAMKKQSEQMKENILNPELAIQTIVGLNITANKENLSKQTKVQIGEELKSLTTYLKKNNFKPEQLMMDKDYYQSIMKAAQENIAQGRLANAAIKKASSPDLLSKELPDINEQFNKPVPQPEKEQVVQNPIKAEIAKK